MLIKLKKNLVKGVKIQPADVHEDDAKEIEAYLKKRKEMEEEERRDEEEILNDASMPEDLWVSSHRQFSLELAAQLKKHQGQ